MTEQQDHPTAGRRRRHKRPAATSQMHDLPVPLLRDHLAAEDDGPSEEEKDAKRLRSASTTPRSARGAHPNDCDRVMGVSSAGSQESVRFGEENDLETECVSQGVAHNEESLDQTCDEDNVYHDANPGVGEIQGG